jgi:hypothetical protein
MARSLSKPYCVRSNPGVQLWQSCIGTLNCGETLILVSRPRKRATYASRFYPVKMTFRKDKRRRMSQYVTISERRDPSARKKIKNRMVGPAHGVQEVETLTNFSHSPECRKRKVKCDERRPVCGQCQKSGRDCHIFDTLFRPHTLSFETTVTHGARKHSPLTSSQVSREGSGDEGFPDGRDFSFYHLVMYVLTKYLSWEVRS